MAGLGSFATPTLEGVARRRLHLVAATGGVLVAAVLGFVALADWQPIELPVLTSAPLLTGLFGLVVLFSVYAFERELGLQRLEHQLIREQVLTASLTSRLREVGAMLEVAQATNLVLELEEVLSTVVRCAAELLDARGGSIMLVHGEGELRTVAVWGESLARGAHVRFGEGIAGRTAATGEPLLVSGTLPRESSRGWLPSSAMSVPLHHGSSLLGVLNVNAAPGRSYTPHDLRALSHFAEQAAASVANAQMYETQRLLASQKLYHALHDPLTGLANRSLFLDRVEHALARRRAKGMRVAVLFLDLDDFRRINDSLGHAAGDRALVAFTERLRGSLRSDDTVARFGGDEFAVLVENVTSESDAAITAERIVSALANPVTVGDEPLWLNVSVGIAMEGVAGSDPNELLRSADTAMHAAKRREGSRIAVFEPVMHTDAIERLRAEGEVRKAFATGEMEVHFQPIVRLRTGEVVAAEALVRWRHPERGLLDAVEFLDAVEAAGMVPTLDRWVLGEACHSWAEIVRSGAAPDLHVNLSPAGLEGGGLVDLVSEVLERSGLAAHHLVLEITEGSVVRQSTAVTTAVQQLKELGVRLAVDDFGTGYSSLAYLRRFPVDIVKVDRAFTEGLGRDSGATALVQAIIRLAHGLALEVIAEGVETRAQADALLRIGCALGQGWLFARALPVGDLHGWLGDGARGVPSMD